MVPQRQFDVRTTHGFNSPRLVLGVTRLGAVSQERPPLRCRTSLNLFASSFWGVALTALPTRYAGVQFLEGASNRVDTPFLPETTFEHEHEALAHLTAASRTQPRLESLHRFAPQKSSYGLENGPRTKMVIRILAVIRVDPRFAS